MPDSLNRLRAALSDRYRVERELGRGGTATVYLATDLRHDRPVALKLLNPELAAAVGPERFLHEIQTTARLTHPHILPLLDSGDIHGTLFFVMPYVAGESLRARLNKEKQLPLDDALRIAREVADALSYAHAQGVVHRDIKPENILLESGHAVVADFGIARAIDAAGGPRLTETGIALGTPAYMSPEQASGSHDLDGRSDLYSLGCVLYEMLAGVPPFSGPTAESLLRQHVLVEPPNVTTIRPSVPGWVAAALTRALAKTPADRFNPVALFAEALTLPSPQIALAGTGSTWRWRRSAIVGLAVMVFGTALLLATLRGNPEPAAAGVTPAARVAVMPFEHRSAGGPLENYGAELQEAVIGLLTRIESVVPISRRSVSVFADSSLSTPQIGVALGAGSMVEGSYQIEGDRVFVRAWLTDVASDAQLWSERYEMLVDSAFEIHADIALRIAEAVGARLSDSQVTSMSARPTSNDRAYTFWLQGEEYRGRPGYLRENLEAAEQLYGQAIALDSMFAAAFASLARVHWDLYGFGHDPTPARLRRQRDAAESALRLAPDLPEARWAMGGVYYRAERDFERALKEFAAAASARPGSADILFDLAATHRRLGNWDSTLSIYEKLTELDPRNADVFQDIGAMTLRFLHRYPEAIQACNRALEVAPDLWEVRFDRAQDYFAWLGTRDSLRAVLHDGPEHLGNISRDQQLVWMALSERRPDSVLALVERTASQAWQGVATPPQLYAAWAHRMRGDSLAASRAFRAALTVLDSVLKEQPGSQGVHMARGLALAGLAQRDDALAEVSWLEGSPDYRSPYSRVIVQRRRAQILAQLGMADAALEHMESLIAGPSLTNIHEVRSDPRFDPIRSDPRFQALLEKYARPPGADSRPN